MNASATWNENLADKKRFKYLIEKALMQLEDYHREAFVLRHIQGCSIAEMEEILGISKGTIKSRIYYATKKVAKVLQEFDPSKDEAHFNMN
jgi:RNA polymerase sigma-70 factor (ECF subfamily)